MAILSYNVKLKANNEQLMHWKNLLAQERQAYNLCSAIVDAEKLSYSRVVIHNTCYDKLRQQFPLLSSQQVIRVQCEVCSAYKSRKNNKHHGDTPKKSGLSMTLDKRLYNKLTPSSICLTDGEKGKRGVYEFVTYERLSELFSTYIPKDPTLFLRNGELYLSIPFEVMDKPCINDTSVGVDLGMKRLFVTSEGKSFKDKAYLRERRKIRYLKRCLQSRGTKSSKRHLVKVKTRERNMSKDMIERSTNALIKSSDAGVFVLEDLSKIKTNTSKTNEGFKRKRHNNALSQVPFYKFKERLSQKAARIGKSVQTVSPTWTSQTDSRSGKRDGERHGCRYYCSDGVVLDADWNAALNIALRANHPTSNCLPIDGGLLFLAGRVMSATQSSQPHSVGGKPTNL